MPWLLPPWWSRREWRPLRPNGTAKQDLLPWVTWRDASFSSPSPTPSRGRHQSDGCAQRLRRTAHCGRRAIDSAAGEAGFYVIRTKGFNRSVRSLFLHQAKLASEPLQGNPRGSKSPPPSWTHSHRSCRFSRRKRCSSTGEMVSISRRIIPRQADCSRAIPSQVGKSFVREATEMESRLIPFNGKRTSWLQ